jgi:hypothetical protein
MALDRVEVGRWLRRKGRKRIWARDWDLLKRRIWTASGHKSDMATIQPSGLAALQGMEMPLNEREASLAPNQTFDWSDSWSYEDLNEFRAASLRRLDPEESEGRFQ